jgi:hypothetical protein
MRTNATIQKLLIFQRAVTELGLMIGGEFHSSLAEKFRRHSRRGSASGPLELLLPGIASRCNLVRPPEAFASFGLCTS